MSKSETENQQLIAAVSTLQQYCTHTACKNCKIKDALACALTAMATAPTRRQHICTVPANWDFTKREENT